MEPPSRVAGDGPLQRPTPESLPAPLLAAARHVARVLTGAGYQAWLVGGCVRDLALGRVPKDVDMVTDAQPDTIEGLFPRTLAVGKAFGTVLVHVAGTKSEGASVDIEVTTFRAEGDYRDGRRPAALTYAPSAAIDVLRRDFTSNALYLDPLGGELYDPTGGLADLTAGVLRTVGEPRDRFREDGLRLWRMARFQAELGLAPVAGLLDAARAERDSLRGVSPERVHAELTRILTSPRPAVGLEVVEACGLWPAGWRTWLERTPHPERRARIRMLPRLSAEHRPEAALCALLAPSAVWSLTSASAEELESASQAHAWLRPARHELSAVQQLWNGLAELGGLLAEPSGARRIRFLRRPDAAAVLELALAPDPDHPPRQDARRAIQELRDFAQTLSPAELHAEPWIRSADLLAAGIAPGPRFGPLLREAEDAQLDGRFADRAAALAWLRERAAHSDPA